MMMWQLLVLSLVYAATGGSPGDSPGHSGGRGGGGWSTTGWASGSWSGGLGGDWRGDWRDGHSKGDGKGDWGRRRDEPPPMLPVGDATAGRPGSGGGGDDEDWEMTGESGAASSSAAGAPPPAGVATAGRQGGGDGAGRQQGRPRNTDEPGYIASWPKPPCRDCQQEVHWRQMMPHKIFQDGEYMRTDFECAQCYGKRLNLDPSEALRKLLEARPDWKAKEDRRTAFAAEQANVMMTFQGLDSKKKAREVTRKALCKVFAPMMSIIARKLRQIMKRHEFMDERAALVQRLEQATDPSVMRTILDELERIEEAVEKASEPLAFSHVTDPFEKARWLLAAQYSDSWTEIRSKSGRVCAGFVTFYVCMRDWGYGERCYSLIVNKRWDLLHKDDPLQAGQRRSLLAELGAFMSCASRPMEHSEVQSLERSCHMLHGIWSTAKRRLWSACVG